MLSYTLTQRILLSTIRLGADGPPLSPERETYGMLLFIQLLHSCLLRRGKSATCYRYSYTLTYRILLSPTSQQRPGCQQYGNQRFHNFMDLQPMTTSPCRHSPPFSPERETFRMLSFSQLSYSYVFVKWKKGNILPSFLLIHIEESTFHHLPAKTGLSIVWKSKIS